MIRPDWITDAMLRYLDELLSAGRTGYGVTADLEREFRLTPHRAVFLLKFWQLTLREGGSR